MSCNWRQNPGSLQEKNPIYGSPASAILRNIAFAILSFNTVPVKTPTSPLFFKRLGLSASPNQGQLRAPELSGRDDLIPSILSGPDSELLRESLIILSGETC